MSATVLRRIQIEINRFSTDPVEGIRIAPHEDNIRYIDAFIKGPMGSPYEGGEFKLEIFLRDGYPMEPPLVRFLTPVYHPNIDKLGRICLDTLKDAWTPAIQIRTMLMSVQALMSTPNLDDPLNEVAAKHWKRDKASAEAEAKRLTALHARAK
ncbi:putative ubiquitin-conjugating enzyme [Monocercomonoides exilis]|uniref:putative ubiquitin-conjugating enzyme n=1 Tax=Monocercomonoides exilis TaxID=2049356 RepID=UPI00355A0B11|nr:putative ubiquitin-conjugating enzyme [Monocercomonoides exilis]|eukprot:MONOS_6658.1-p1 / transcript=MONOS_6658.1 / gene=MONOS_6658 / organism=Monocercomonoides_exilis_PA203 / gene_product=ubiquitin-conjugating enzyme / transcript_product=ubiquitin-conjugating enzyme / location=Mono_scaffold00214:7774-8519(-) / protein_length=152 / sequence_SO=supercontig / SO=protein_coding / is_pseudo=false